MTSEKRRVVHLIHLDGPGGGPRIASQHVEYQKDHFEIIVIHGGQGYLTETCRRLGIKEVQLPLARLSECFGGFILLVNELKKLKPDLMVLHGQWAGPIGAMAARLAGVRRTIYLCHWPSFYTDWDLRRVVRNFLAEVIPGHLASRVIAISRSNHDKYLQFGLASPERLVMIPNPINSTLAPSESDGLALRKELGWSSAHCHVVSIGRLVDQKRLDWLLNAWKIVQASEASAKLWIIGDGPLEETLRGLADRLGISASCTFLGARPDGWKCIAAADVVAMSSQYEGHAGVPLEAMACGKPIIANDVDGIRDSLTDGEEGFLIPPGDPAAFAHRLIKLVQDPQLRSSMGSAGRSSVQKFSPEFVFRAHREMMLSLIAE